MSRPGRTRGDDGRITVLVIGYFVVVALLLGVVWSIAAVQTARQRLHALADAAALEAAQAVDEGAYYAAGLGGPAAGAGVAADAAAGAGGAAGIAPEGSAGALPLSDAGVREAAADSLAAAGADERFPTLVVGGATGSPDGVTAQVVLSAVVEVPMLPAAVGDAVGGVPLTVVSRARAPLG